MSGHASAGIYRFLKIKFIAHLVFRIRFLYLVYLRRSVRVYDDEKGVVSHDYSKRRLYKSDPQRRIMGLIEPLSVIQILNFKSKILVIGCRYETDMLYLIGNGFHPGNVRGLDMISYSPWTDLGNMHAMQYADDSWDATICGWTLSYSDQPELAASEMTRVTRSGGLIAIGVSYYPRETLVQKEKENSLIGTVDERIQTTEGILALFGDNVNRVIFNHNAADPGKHGHCLVIFSIKK